MTCVNSESMACVPFLHDNSHLFLDSACDSSGYSSSLGNECLGSLQHCRMISCCLFLLSRIGTANNSEYPSDAKLAHPIQCFINSCRDFDRIDSVDRWSCSCEILTCILDILLIRTYSKHSPWLKARHWICIDSSSILYWAD